MRYVEVALGDSVLNKGNVAILPSSSDFYNNAIRNF